MRSRPTTHLTRRPGWGGPFGPPQPGPPPQGEPMSLRDLPFRLSYTTADDPLHTFYIPALSVSVRYDRMAGFFSSSALAVAAAGVAHLIAGGGQMRLLVGAALHPEDVEAIRRGHDLREVVAARMEAALPDPDTLTDTLMRDRLEALAWMVAHGFLDLRVVLPRGKDGLPLPAEVAREYFHPKVGIFTDAAGNQIAFSGSVNESATAWRDNYEHLVVFRSWTEEGRQYVAEVVRRFERLWEGREPDWIALPVPEAVRRRLLRYQPERPPRRDPLERAPVSPERAGRGAPALGREEVLGRFLSDLPRLVGAEGVGMATAAVVPWPHQWAVARRVAEAFPTRYLLADEVGLGKTVEAGLVLRELWLRGIVRRALILAPRSVLRQWQEELYEKFALSVPLYDGAVFRDIHGREFAPSTPNPWDGVDLALVSAQLVKRKERRDLLLSARPWDLVIVDEAHHARRRDFQDLSRYRPNRMLDLLIRLERRTQGLLLLTATPMQVHPVEVWDLLRLLGLGGLWGSDERAFLRFYEQLRLPAEEVDWPFVLRLARADREATDGRIDPTLEEQWRRRLGPVDWDRVRRAVEEGDPSPLRSLSPEGKEAVRALVRAQAPLARRAFRHTRALLREYARRGLLRERVPTREPHLVWIPMRPPERALYDRIEEYIVHFYRRYEGERKGLGFVMTVYRRRLTSSFYAVRRSLERRLAFLRGQADLGLEEDLEQDALSGDVDEWGPGDREVYRGEIAYLEDFLEDLSRLEGPDSKVERLLEDLQEIFRQRETVLVFTQYTDTMDFLREQLRGSYGRQVACYSGRGGERWDGVMWVPVGKEEVKNDFREGRIKVLLCTDAASEGLNLQTCGVLINYDMPWNPMRVEQRIGRVDRIGQRYERVEIRNYFYEGTVEAQVYQALSRRIRWFEEVVGRLQPILTQVGEAIEEAAMTPAAEREGVLRRQLERIEAQLEGAARWDLDEWAGQVVPEMSGRGGPADGPVSLPELEEALLTLPGLRERFRPHPQIAGAYSLQDEKGGEETVTFDPAVFDAHPETVQLLTFGNPLLEALLGRRGSGEPEAFVGPFLRLRTEGPPERVGYYGLDGDGRPRPVVRLAEVRRVLEETVSGKGWTEEAMEAARWDFRAQVEAERARRQAGWEQLEQARERARAARAARMLVQAALIELALGQQRDLWGEERYPTAFDRSAVLGLRRHGYPWTALLRLAQEEVEAPSPTDPFFLEIQGETREQLRGRWERLQQQAEMWLEEVGRSG